MQNLLKEVTFKSLKEFKTQDIVLPGDYSDIFLKYAKEHDLNIEDKEVILKNLSHDKDELDKITKETSFNLNSLSDSTKQAQVAIVNKDLEALKSVHGDIEKMQEQILNLQTQLTTDSLTKAKNRKWFFDLHLLQNKFTANGYLIFIDLNSFKIINDTYGHVVGDLVLKYLSSYLQTELENEDAQVVRYAGDEFMLIFHESKKTLNELTLLLDVIQEKLSKRKLQSKKIKSLQFSFSYGISNYKKDDDFKAIIEEADKKMYLNKVKVKNQQK